MDSDYEPAGSLFAWRPRRLKGIWAFPDEGQGQAEQPAARPGISLRQLAPPSTRWMDNLIENQRLLRNAPMLGDGRARNSAFDLGPVFDGWSMYGDGHVSAGGPPGADLSLPVGPSPFSRRESAERNRGQTFATMPQRPAARPTSQMVEAPGELMRLGETPELPARRMPPERDKEFSRLFAQGASPQELRAFVRNNGVPHFTDNFDEMVKRRDTGKKVANHVQYDLPPSPKQPDGATGAAARGFADPFNLLDEAGAVVDVLGGTGNRQNIWNSDRSLIDLYHDNVDLNRSILKADQRDHPWARAGGQIASNLILPIGNKAGTAAQLAKWGAVQGGLAGFGAGEGNPLQRLPGAASGAVGGAALGYGGGRIVERAQPMVDVVRSQLGFPRIGPHGPIYSHLSGDYRAARDRLLAEQTGEVPGALHHPEIGPIDLIYGTGQHGLRHIERDHANVLNTLPEIVSETPVKISAAHNQKGRFFLQDENHDVVIPTDWHGAKKTWLLTAYRREGAPGDQTPGRDPLPPDGVSTGAEQLRSLDVPGDGGKRKRAVPPAYGPGSSPETPVPVTSAGEMNALKPGTWVSYKGRVFPKG